MQRVATERFFVTGNVIHLREKHAWEHLKTIFHAMKVTFEDNELYCLIALDDYTIIRLHRSLIAITYFASFHFV